MSILPRFNTVLDVLDKSIKQVKLFLFADEMMSHTENPKEYIHTKLLELINKFNKVSRYKIKKKRSVVFLYTSNKQSKTEIKKTPFIIASKRIKYLE